MLFFSLLKMFPVFALLKILLDCSFVSATFFESSFVVSPVSFLPKILVVVLAWVFPPKRVLTPMFPPELKIFKLEFFEELSI